MGWDLTNMKTYFFLMMDLSFDAELNGELMVQVRGGMVIPDGSKRNHNLIVNAANIGVPEDGSCSLTIVCRTYPITRQNIPCDGRFEDMMGPTRSRSYLFVSKVE